MAFDSAAFDPDAFDASQVFTQSLSGSMTPAGSLTTSKLFGQVLAGSITPAGALSKVTGHVLPGASMTMAGALSRVTNKYLAGSISMTVAFTTGTVFARTLTASMALAGSLSKLTRKALSASIAMTGNLRTFAGARNQLPGPSVSAITGSPTVSSNDADPPDVSGRR